jgi:hypothetical protein
MINRTIRAMGGSTTDDFEHLYDPKYKYPFTMLNVDLQLLGVGHGGFTDELRQELHQLAMERDELASWDLRGLGPTEDPPDRMADWTRRLEATLNRADVVFASYRPAIARAARIALQRGLTTW